MLDRPAGVLTGRPVLVAPDAFKGTLRAAQVAGAIERGLPYPVDLCPLGDGGEGTAEALLLALGGETGGARVSDPWGEPIDAGFALLEGGGTAVVEVAAASGPRPPARSEGPCTPARSEGPCTAPGRDAETASSAGTGELILAAVAAGAEVVLVCAGGSATTDGGRGAIEAIEAGGGLAGARLVVLCDVRVPWERAAPVFAPQKGADPATVARLAERLDAYAGELPRDPRGVPLTGAAGGLSGGLWAAFGAVLEPGAPFVLEAVGFDARMRAARAVITGEGRIDPTSLLGKLVGELGTRTRQAGVPFFAVCAQDDLPAFEKRMIDLQVVETGSTPAAIEEAAARLVPHLPTR